MPRRDGNVSGKSRRGTHKKRAHGSAAKSHQYKAKKIRLSPRGSRPTSD